jgi:CheY-like chemotaxis protein
VRFRQILLNLLSNVVKYNYENGNISVFVAQMSASLLRLNVKDTGIGIAPENHSEIFAPFKCFSDNQGEVQGVGIGLAISRQLAHVLNGKLGFVSKIGSGSTFWLEMPVCNTDNSRKFNIEDTLVVPVDSKVIRDSVTDSAQSGCYKVVCVEDNPVNIELIKIVFSEIDLAQVLFSTSAEKGIELIERILPDLVIMDIGLPGMNGIAATKILKQNELTREIPVIAISAAAISDEIEKSLGAGFESYLTKPLDIPTFVTMIETYVLNNRPRSLNQ